MRYPLLFIVVLLLAGFGLCAGVVGLLDMKLGVEVNLPVLAIVGIVLMLGMLALIAIGFSMVNLADRTEALGLPPGSIRGVIALSLVVLFAILSVFLFSELKDGATTTIASCLSNTGRNEMVRNLAGRAGVYSLQNAQTETGLPCPKTTTLEAVAATQTADEHTITEAEAKRAKAEAEKATAETAAAAKARAEAAKARADEAKAKAETTEAAWKAGLYMVSSRDPANQAAADFAKQLLVLIGTLVTAIASFYFGAKAVTDASANAVGGSGPPTINGVTPSPVVRGGGSPIKFTVTGANLNDVKQVHLQLGATRINGTEMVSNAGQVQANFVIDDTPPDGKWDIEVVDAAGRTAKLAGQVTIPPLAGRNTIAPSSAPAEPPPKPESVTPNTVIRGQTVSLTIAGSNLTQVKKVRIESGKTRIDDTTPQPGADKVQAKFTVEATAPLGAWDIVVTDAAGLDVKLAGALTVTVS